MNQKQIGILLIIVGVLLASVVYLIKLKDDFYINTIIQERNSCYLDDGTCLHEDRNMTLYFVGWTISAILLFIGIFFTFLININKDKEEPKPIEPKEIKKEDYQKITGKLKEDEKVIFEKIIEAQGSIFQSDLVEKTGFTKVKVTRILDKLEGLALIERRRRGMTNVVLLKHN
jgi:hypothetical protein